MYGAVKIGFCPIGKFAFSHEDAKVYKSKLEKKFGEMGVNYIGIDKVITDGIIRSYDDASVAVEFLEQQKIDCLFIPHCNFGTESAAGLIAKKLGVPTLLWGPRDGAPLEDGTRLRDSLCGMFASSKVLVKLGVPFSYIENCEIDDYAFEAGLDKFIRAANIARKLKNAKIGIIGNRIDFFWSTIVNENELLQKFGIEILPLDLSKVVRLTKEMAAADRNRYLKEIESLGKKIDINAMSEAGMLNVLALRDVLYKFAVENKLSALAVESFMSLVEELDACVSFAQAAVSDMGIPCISESDINGAISSIIAEAAALNTSSSFLADLTVRHPSNDNGLLLWHDSFPLSLKDPKCRGSLGSHWILPGFKPGMCHWKLKDGDITIVRFDGEAGAYKLMAEESKTIDGPFTQNTYVWVEFGDWKKFERKLIEGPYIHHTACIYGNYSEALKEACKYINGLEFDVG
jgi:L-fucose isomerase and related proteins